MKFVGRVNASGSDEDELQNSETNELDEQTSTTTKMASMKADAESTKLLLQDDY